MMSPILMILVLAVIPADGNSPANRDMLVEQNDCKRKLADTYFPKSATDAARYPRSPRP